MKSEETGSKRQTQNTNLGPRKGNAVAIAFDIVDHDDLDLTKIERLGLFRLSVPSALPDSDLLECPGWTLFSFDFPSQQVIFIDVGPGQDLSSAPFSYLAQVEHGRRIATLDYAAFIALAARIAVRATFVQLFNIGHCGSTLLHHVFNRAPGAWSISEPSFLFDLAMKRDDFGTEELRALISAGLKFLTKFDGADTAEVIVVKHFSQSMTILEQVYRAMPEAVCFFMYRDAESWCNSFYHFLQRDGVPNPENLADRTFLWWIASGDTPVAALDGIIDLSDNSVKIQHIMAANWAQQLLCFRKAQGAGVPMVPLRYNELNGDRAGELGKVFDHCGIPRPAIPAALAAFSQDAHAGSATAGTIKADDLTAESYATIRRILALPNLNLPGDTILTM